MGYNKQSFPVFYCLYLWKWPPFLNEQLMNFWTQNTHIVKSSCKVTERDEANRLASKQAVYLTAFATGT